MIRRLVPFTKKSPRVAVIRLSGTIASGGRNRLNDENTAPMIERAFRRGKPDAVALVINSPGGSPVQSSLIAARIRRLAEETKRPVHAFVEDVAASGGYWLACTADQIWVDASSIVGSIGVISSGFGLQDFIARQGIERRVHTSGKSKSMLDMFQAEKPADVARLKDLQNTIHEAFIAYVRDRRGNRLKADEDLFTGQFWVGEPGVALGLADGIGHLVPKMKSIYGDKVQFRVHGPRRSLMGRFGISAGDIADEVLTLAEDRNALARFGL